MVTIALRVILFFMCYYNVNYIQDDTPKSVLWWRRDGSRRFDGLVEVNSYRRCL